MLRAAVAAIAEAVANGELAAGEAAELGKLVESFVRALEVTDFRRKHDLE
jgi:hypothetical protein